MITEFICNIEKIVYGGNGISTYEGIKVFVPYSAPGDNLLVKIKEKNRDYYVAQIKKIIQPSPNRTQPSCPYFGTCGGCSLQHITYTSQLEIKKQFAIESLQRIGHISPLNSVNITPSAPFNYRNKTQYPLSRYRQKIGFYQQLTHKVVDIKECLLHPPVFDRIRSAIKEQLKNTKESIYDETKHTGNLRHIVIRQGQRTEEILIIFVTRTDTLNEKLYQPLPNQFNNIIGIVQNINPEQTNRILNRKNKLLSGRDFYYEHILDKKFKISANAFFQVNTTQSENLIKKLRTLVEPSNTILDLYCGVGLLSIMIADKAKMVYGVELEKQAIQDAKENLALNNITNIKYISAPVEREIKNYHRIDTIIIDPPRKGCLKSFLIEIIKLKPKQIIYISCNPTTLARDLAILDNLGYKTTEIELFDMFPQTFHVESIAKIIPK